MPVTRILIEPGDYELDNMGCVAMLQVAVARLTRLWPDAAIGIITSKPEHLAAYCSAAQPVSRNGYRLWFSDQLLLGRLHKALPRKVSSGLIRLKWLLRRRWPCIVERLTRLKLHSDPDNTRDLREFLHAAKGADLLVILGPGSLTDHAFRQGVMSLGLIEMAISLGKHTAMVGHGLGPMRHPGLTIRAKQILPKVSFIALREKRAGIKLLESVGVSREQVLITGDDAIELAYGKRLEGAGEGIGVALRLLHSSDV